MALGDMRDISREAEREQFTQAVKEKTNKIEQLRKALEEIEVRCFKHTAEINGINVCIQNIRDTVLQALKGSIHGE